MKNAPLFFLLLLAVLLAAHLCHLDILWAEETLPMAAAAQILHGKTLYRDVWFDKPPLLAWTYLLWGAHDGFPVRLAGTLYVLLACYLIWRFARDLWGKREALWAANLLAFFLLFDIPSAVLPLAADLLMLAPHLAAVWLACRGRAFWSGVLAGIAFLINAKGLFVLASCAIWDVRSLPLLLAGFAVPNAAAAGWMWIHGALPEYYAQVWKWGRIYAGVTFVENPVRNGIVRTAHWLGYHAAIVLPALWFWMRDHKAGKKRWAAWAAISMAAVALGWRFFPRYYFQLLPVVVLASARGFTMLGRRRALAFAALLLIPFLRFGPRYFLLANDLLQRRPHHWVDTAMDQDSRKAAFIAARLSKPGDTLFVWGFRPELYVYTGLPADSRFLDSQPLTGVPADRHLTESRPVASESIREHRAELARSNPTLILDGLGPFNPHLAITRFDDLRPWLSQYTPVATSGLTLIYRRIEAPVLAASPPGPASRSLLEKR
ncbi:MAG: glycosyltransferase family 39 protein [Bryobacteraceae bacterium]